MTKKQRHRLNGWINLNKPLELSSAGAVNKLKWLWKPEKIGHAGTLDPLATGVLPIALGEGTKCVNLLMDAKKVYVFTVTFGERRSTDDAEGEVVARCDVLPSEVEIRAVLPRFTGPIQQVPPAYSAIKVNGERAYALARAGETVALKPRQVTIHALELLGCEEVLKTPNPLSPGERVCVAHFRATVSKGTYIRSLGRDIAAAAGSLGYISRLHRAAVGPFRDTDAISLDFLEKTDHKTAPILPLGTALDDIPALALDGEQLTRLRHGQAISLSRPVPPAAPVAVLHEGQLVALGRTDGLMLYPVRLLLV